MLNDPLLYVCGRLSQEYVYCHFSASIDRLKVDVIYSLNEHICKKGHPVRGGLQIERT